MCLRRACGALSLQALSMAGLLLLGACKASKPVPNADADKVYLPSFPPIPEQPKAATAAPAQQGRPTPNHADNAAVALWQDSVAARNKRISLARGYRVLVYRGPDRAAAMAAKESLYRHYPELEVYLSYAAPDFRLLAGDYLNRLEAQLGAKALQKHFPNPLILADQVKLRR